MEQAGISLRLASICEIGSPAADAMVPVIIIRRAEVEPERRAIVIGRAVIIGWRSIIGIPIPRWPRRRVQRHPLIHVEVDLLRNEVFRAAPLACSRVADLLELIRGQL